MEKAQKKEMHTLSELKDLLLASNWPRCNVIAGEIEKIGGPESVEAFKAALKSRRHHVRSAAIKGLRNTGDRSVIPSIEPHLKDLSYETRLDAQEAIDFLEGRAGRAQSDDGR